jgi:hypothetical protein
VQYEVVAAKNHAEAMKLASMKCGDLAFVSAVHAMANTNGTYSVWYDFNPFLKLETDDAEREKSCQENTIEEGRDKEILRIRPEEGHSI